jgi:hypothetical protein
MIRSPATIPIWDETDVTRDILSRHCKPFQIDVCTHETSGNEFSNPDILEIFDKTEWKSGIALG